MRIAPWKIMAGLSVLLVLVGVVASLGDLGPVQLVLGGGLLGAVVGAMYLGWRIGRRWGEERRSAE